MKEAKENGRKAIPLPPRVKNLTGRVFGKLRIVSFAKLRHSAAYWWCSCECGKQKEIRTNDLMSGSTVTCGNCLNRFQHAPDGITTIIWLETKTGPSVPCLIDTKDYNLIKDYHWHLGRPKYGKTLYVHATINTPRRVTVIMHRLLFSRLKASETIDHVSGDGLDNRRRNLRKATSRENSLNKGKRRGKYLSRFKGVSKTAGKFVASIQANGRIHLGSFENEKDAARAYNEAAKKHYGKFAFLNDLDDESTLILDGKYLNGPQRGKPTRRN
jgi:hypothetical protein